MTTSGTGPLYIRRPPAGRTPFMWKGRPPVLAVVDHNLDGEFADSAFPAADFVDGGAADSVYLPGQLYDGGPA